MSEGGGHGFHLLFKKMIKIERLINYSKKDDLYKLWNTEYKNIFPISKELFERNLRNAYLNASFVALDNEKLVGFIIGKIWLDEFKIEGYDRQGWISLIYVCPKYRKRGIGSNLLKHVEDEFELLNKSIIHIGRDYNNYFPGLPENLKDNLQWFINRGYENDRCTFDLICKNKGKITLVNSNYTFRLASIDDKDKVIDFLNRNWPGRWTKENLDYWNNGGTGKECAICLDKGKVCAFAKLGYPSTPELQISNSLTWRDWFKALGGIGPLGVDKEYRGRHLGHDIVAFSFNVLIEEEVTDIIIDWTSLIDFYSKFGFSKWKSYYYLTKFKKEN